MSMTCQCVRAYAFTLKVPGEQKHYSRDEAGAQVHEQAKAYAERHGVPYATALRVVLADPDNRDVVRAYAAVDGGVLDWLNEPKMPKAETHIPKGGTGRDALDAGDEIDLLAKRIAAKENLPYFDAYQRAKRERRDLAARYGGMGPKGRSAG